MRLRNIRGKLVNRAVEKKRIKWEKKSRSILQTKVKEILAELWAHDIVYEEFPVFGTKLSVDFYNASKGIVIEVQGRQHTKFVKHFHNDSIWNFEDQLRRDRSKRRFCEINDITLIEILEEDKKKFSLEFIKEIIENES